MTMTRYKLWNTTLVFVAGGIFAFLCGWTNPQIVICGIIFPIGMAVFLTPQCKD